jgi:hypothetical protein
MHMDEHWLTMGRKKVEAGHVAVASRRPRQPVAAYPAQAVTPEYPGFKEKLWLDRELAGDFEPDTKLIMAG